MAGPITPLVAIRLGATLLKKLLRRKVKKGGFKSPKKNKIPESEKKARKDAKKEIRRSVEDQVEGIRPPGKNSRRAESLERKSLRANIRKLGKIEGAKQASKFVKEKAKRKRK